MRPPREGTRADLAFGLGWTALGAAVAVGSWRMDRLEHQGVEPYAVPGLLPGLLGVLLAGLGVALALRGWRGGSRAPEGRAGEEAPRAPAEPWRVALALALCVGFVAGALGRGPPFWLAAFLFVFLSILLFEWPDRRRDGTLAGGAVQAFHRGGRERGGHLRVPGGVPGATAVRPGAVGHPHPGPPPRAGEGVQRCPTG